MNMKNIYMRIEKKDEHEKGLHEKDVHKKKSTRKKDEHEKMRRKINIRKNLLYLWTTYYSWKKLQIEDRKTHVRHENMRRKKKMKEIYMRIWEEIWTRGRSFPINEPHMVHQRIFKSEIGGLMLAKASNLSAEDSCWKKLQIWVQKIHVGRSIKSELE